MPESLMENGRLFSRLHRDSVRGRENSGYFPPALRTLKLPLLGNVTSPEPFFLPVRWIRVG